MYHTLDHNVTYYMGHYVPLCFRGGKPRKPRKGKETVKIETEDQSGNSAQQPSLRNLLLSPIRHQQR